MTPIDSIFLLIILLFSTIIHEIAHGYMALSLGDTTARDSGRLTLNPIRHLDLFGSIILPALLYVSTAGQGPIFGWAKPVPINPLNFIDKKWGVLKVSIAGPLTNVLIAVIFALFAKFLPLSENFLFFFGLISITNFAWAIFNLLPIPPLDGSHILFTFLPESFLNFKIFLSQYGFMILLLLIFTVGFNWIFYWAFKIFSLIYGPSTLF